MALGRRIWEALGAYFRERMGLTVAVLASLVTGVLAGALVARAAPQATRDELFGMLQNLFRSLGQGEVGGWSLFWLSAWQNLRWLLLLWFLGVTVVGFLGILPVVFARGFASGFAVGFLVDALGFRGLVLSLFSLFPQLAISIPTLLLAAVAAMSFSRGLFSERRSRGFVVDLLGFSLLVGLLVLPLLGASLVEAFVSPVFLRLVGPGW